MPRIAFAWPGLPDYAARCIRGVIKRQAMPVSVVATPPSVPIEGMERSLGQPVHWIDGSNPDAGWSSLGTKVPDVLFCGGYSLPAFNALARRVHQEGGRVILMSDNNWQGSLRQRTLDPLRHRLLFRSRFDGIFVPGASGERVAHSWGYRNGAVARGLYGADPTLFHWGPPLQERSRTFLFVGQFIARKNVLGLAEAFVRFADQFPDWSLSLCGAGVQENNIPRHPGIEVRGFVQPLQLAELLRQVRCLVLPSLEEHWGVVVHEAVLSGCALALSTTVGAADDLARNENAVLFPPGDTEAIARALADIAVWDDDRWTLAARVSRELAAAFGPEAFADGVDSLIPPLNGKVLRK